MQRGIVSLVAILTIPIKNINTVNAKVLFIFAQKWGGS